MGCELFQFADSQPHAAYSVLTHGLTVNGTIWQEQLLLLRNLLSPLEDMPPSVTRMKVRPNLTGKEPSNAQEKCFCFACAKWWPKLG